MIADVIAGKFAQSILERDAKFIALKQQEVVRDYNLFKTGALENSLKQHFSVANIGGGAQLTMRYLACHIQPHSIWRALETLANRIQIWLYRAS